MNAPAWAALEQLRDALSLASTEADRLREENAAWRAVSSDRRTRLRHLRVYRWCLGNLGDTPISPKLQTIADQITRETGKRIGVGDVSNAISGLVRMGYLTEHPRDDNGARRLTLRRFLNSLNTTSAAEPSAAA